MSLSAANGYEASPSQQKSGIFIGASAGVPPEGIYMFNQFFTYQSNIVGPVTGVIGNKTGFQAAVDVQGFLFVPGWTVLGATYDAVVVVPFVTQSAGSPLNAQASGMYNTYIVPAELSWKIADTGFQVKTGLGMFVPDGTITGPGGTGNIGKPYWTFQPEAIVSYLKDGWNLSAAIYGEFNTANRITGYRTGNILHADFTATKTIGNWTFGPVGYYVGQVSNDKSSAYYGNLIQNANRYDIWSVGGLVGYNFGPANFSVWATQEVSARASGATAGGPVDVSGIAKGFTALATLSFRLWGPDEAPVPKRPLIHK
ncbi:MULTISPECIES: transporter [unclassified Bradyrhizobium]|uniref:SphA family protein n=1 Tax=unclassified Bradyrhizobium TaxID=2631580 RepID=UPI002479E294|nr:MULTISPECIES: transporter [unclassified Bradyrhizobium]WGR73153.1 transporter [Bradyrhizobium sp. ISRA426]WGR77993.1 transporter [Bradyrhizobium sp. ISRA430]WGR88394.1 transporter [Bradyrhizobium sp. ISRA432]